MDDSVLYPEGMTDELVARLYGHLTVDWSSKPFTFDLSRSECRFWFDFCVASIHHPGGSWQTGTWPRLANVIRREQYENDPGRVFQWGNGLVFEQGAPEKDDVTADV